MKQKFKPIPELEELFGKFYMSLEKPLNDKNYTSDEKSIQLIACFYATIKSLYHEQTGLFLNKLLEISLSKK